MTLDQIWFRLCDRELLKRKVGGRTEKVEASMASAAVRPGPDGKMAGRDKDGNPIQGIVRGKSVARQLIEEAAKKKASGKKKGRKRRKR